MQNGKWREPFTPGLIDVDVLGEPAEGYTIVGFDAGAEGDERYTIEVDSGLVDPARGVMVVLVLKDYDDGNCLVKLPGESFFYNDRAILPQGKIYVWSPRGHAKQKAQV